MPTPDFLTVEEAGAVLRIGRTAMYEATRRWRETDGAEGIPVIKIGGTLRVPRHCLEEMAGGPIELPAATESEASDMPRSITARTTSSTTRACRTETDDDSTQTALPISA